MSDGLQKTPLHALHVALGARMVEFGGWHMPVQYSGVIDEHLAVRGKVGLFDVSHMGEVEVRGKDALAATNRVITNDLTRIEDGQALYTAMCRPDGGIVDDLVVYRMSPERIFICVNAANRAKDFAWIREHLGPGAEAIDRGDEFAQIAVQGPRAAELVARVTSVPLAGMKSYRFAEATVLDRPAIVSRTGYTGEDGFELYVPPEVGAPLFSALLERGKDLGVQPIGLGARDSLRLEMKFALYGNDIDDTTNPLEAGLGWIVKLDKPDFVGKGALEAVKAAGPKRRLVGFEVLDAGIARHGYPVVDEADRPIGQVTSGTKGPSVGKAIGMAYVPVERSAIGAELRIQIRGQAVRAKVVKTPFYARGA